MSNVPSSQHITTEPKKKKKKKKKQERRVGGRGLASSTSGGSTRGKRKAVDRYDDIEQQSAPKRSKRISQNAANTTMVLE